jgi:hypothetical protein
LQAAEGVRGEPTAVNKTSLGEVAVRRVGRRLTAGFRSENLLPDA